jgi:hypothetical protein
LRIRIRVRVTEKASAKLGFNRRNLANESDAGRWKNGVSKTGVFASSRNRKERSDLCVISVGFHRYRVRAK